MDDSAIQAAQSAAASAAVSGGYFIIGLFIVGAGVIALTLNLSPQEEIVAQKEFKGEIEVAEIQV